MINKISIVACLFLINNFVFCMDEGQITDKYELNRKAYVEITSASCNISKLKKFFDEGADPNYALPECGTTHLMKAVRMNNLDYVKLMLEKGVNVHARNNKNFSARGYNIIHTKKELQRYLYPLVTYMLQLETHNATNENKLDIQKYLFADNNAIYLYNALLIDKYLEDAGATLKRPHHLCSFLKRQSSGSKCKRVLMALGNIYTYLPKSVIQACDDWSISA